MLSGGILKPLEIVHVDGYSAYRLSNEAFSIVVIPALGGKIASLVSKKTSAQWLWRNAALSYKSARYGDSYVRVHDTGGIDECVPTLDACKLPASTGIWSGSQLPDHGEIFSQPWDVVSATVDDEGTAILHLEVEGEALPYRFQRVLRLPTGKAALEIEYRVDNRSLHAMPFYWCMHPILNITADMRIRLPEGQRMHTTWSSDVAPTLAGERFDWPVTKFGYDMSRIPDASIPAFAAKIFTDTPLSESKDGAPEVCVGLDNVATGEQLNFSFLPSDVPYVALWLNYGVWHGAGQTPYFNLGFEPSNANTDSLTQQVSDGNQALLIEPKAYKTWRVLVGLT